MSTTTTINTGVNIAVRYADHVGTLGDLRAFVALCDQHGVTDETEIESNGAYLTEFTVGFYTSGSPTTATPAPAVAAPSPVPAVAEVAAPSEPAAVAAPAAAAVATSSAPAPVDVPVDPASVAGVTYSLPQEV